ncbi:isoprenoid synthase domain-containing protein [Aspergillus pseudodeflectus]|uniref:Isoprenoid synthase domain-containing protein n=1 Tax=Aspergillus pseudodeflectus TaxID=176178 RepID=A0ABR4KWZ1_9EURO
MASFMMTKLTMLLIKLLYDSRPFRLYKLGVFAYCLFVIQLLNENKKLLDALNETGCSSSLTIHSDSTRRRSEVQAKIAAECFRLDPMFGRQFILIWEAFMQSTGYARQVDFSCLDNYLTYRLGDVGARWAICMLGWGTGIHLTPDEERTIAPISDVAYAALALTNDLFSWEKELKSHLESKGQVPLVNAVHVVMASNNVTERTAKAVVKEEIRAHEEQFSLLRKQYMATTDRSQSVISWLQLLQDTMAGNMAWSLKTPRYSKTIQNPYKDHFKASTKDVISILGHYTGPVISDICDRS